MTYTEQLRREQFASLDRALEQYAALSDWLATEPVPDDMADPGDIDPVMKGEKPMKEYSRRITGVMNSGESFCFINGLSIEEMICGMLGRREYFPATISICITDLTEDTGVPEEDEEEEET